MARKCLLIFNPFAGNNPITGVQLLEMAEVRIPDFSVELWTTTGDDDQEKIRKQFDKTEPDLVLIGGGDGTVNLVANSLHGMKVPLCILPLGSANGLAKSMRIPDLVDSWEAVLDFKIQAIDAIQINRELCLHLADFGMNANLIRKFEQEDTRGMFGYVKNSLSEIFSYEPKTFNLLIGDKSLEIRAKMIVIANADQYGTGAIVNCKGLMDDGKFEIIAINPQTSEDYLRMTMAFFRGDLDQVEGVQTWSVEECQLLNPEGAEFQIDGEMMEPTESITAKIKKHAFQFLTGKSFAACHTS
jgi:diacylglycerol kinase (ATP)